MILLFLLLLPSLTLQDDSLQYQECGVCPECVRNCTAYMDDDMYINCQQFPYIADAYLVMGEANHDQNNRKTNCREHCPFSVGRLTESQLKTYKCWNWENKKLLSQLLTVYFNLLPSIQVSVSPVPGAPAFTCTAGGGDVCRPGGTGAANGENCSTAGEWSYSLPGVDMSDVAVVKQWTDGCCPQLFVTLPAPANNSTFANQKVSCGWSEKSRSTFSFSTRKKLTMVTSEVAWNSTDLTILGTVEDKDSRPAINRFQLEQAKHSRDQFKSMFWILGPPSASQDVVRCESDGGPDVTVSVWYIACRKPAKPQQAPRLGLGLGLFQVAGDWGCGKLVCRATNRFGASVKSMKFSRLSEDQNWSRTNYTVIDHALMYLHASLSPVGKPNHYPEVYTMDRVQLECRVSLAMGDPGQLQLGVGRNNTCQYRTEFISPNITASFTETMLGNDSVGLSCCLMTNSSNSSTSYLSPSPLKLKNVIPPHTTLSVAFSEDGHNKSQMSYDGERQVVVVRSKTIVSLKCSATGSPRPEYYWARNTSQEEIFPWTKKTKVVMEVTWKDSGNYTCCATVMNTYKNCSSVTLKVVSGGVQQAVVSTLVPLVVLLVVGMTILSQKLHQTRKKKRDLRQRVCLSERNLERMQAGFPDQITDNKPMNEQGLLMPYSKNIEFPYENLSDFKFIGNGAYGKVFKATANGIKDGEETTTVAVKTIKTMGNLTQTEVLFGELKMMANVGMHDNIVSILGACTQSLMYGEFCVILEYCPHGSLQTFLRNYKAYESDPEKRYIRMKPIYSNISNKRISGRLMRKSIDSFGLNFSTTNEARKSNVSDLTTYTIVSDNLSIFNCSKPNSEYSRAEEPLTYKNLYTWSLEIASGMEYLASKRVVHCDLAARNILLDQEKRAKICDFGLATKHSFSKDYVRVKKEEGDLMPLWWMSPEAVTEHRFSEKSDAWSYGITVWEIFQCGDRPCRDTIVETGREPEDFVAGLRNGARLEQPGMASTQLYQIMLACWNIDPDKRPTFSKLVKQLRVLVPENDEKVDLNLILPCPEGKRNTKSNSFESNQNSNHHQQYVENNNVQAYQDFINDGNRVSLVTLASQNMGSD